MLNKIGARGGHLIPIQISIAFNIRACGELLIPIGCCVDSRCGAHGWRRLWLPKHARAEKKGARGGHLIPIESSIAFKIRACSELLINTNVF